ALFRLSQLPYFDKPQSTCNHAHALAIPGRKLGQICAFSACLPPHQGEYLEWCAGKGHLARWVSLSQRVPVRCIEWQAQLCQEGEQLAQRDHALLSFYCADAFAAQTAQLLAPHHHAIALHACGDLHSQLVKNVVDKQLAGVSLSPCCYHLIHSSHYQPLSDLAKVSPLQLSKADLKLPLQETVTGGARIARLREQEVIWRLAFDCLQQQVRQVTQYLPVPSMAKSLLSGSFADFCQWAAEQKQITLPSGLDYEYFLSKGQMRFLEVAKMDLVRHLFRRPLELWLTLDKACYLQQHGYQVTIGEFCPKPMTPRNILLNAQLGSAHR
ncbi:MAG: methyltransferase, partial [Shewanella sp.]